MNAAEAKASEMGGLLWVVKAQIYVGGRSKDCLAVSEAVDASNDIYVSKIDLRATGLWHKL